MLDDECNQLLVIHPFTDDNSTASTSYIRDTLVSLTQVDSAEHHPLHDRSVLPARCSSAQATSSVTSVEGEEELATASDAPQGDNNITRHPVGPNDSFAGVALRYGVSIAAIRRANQLWPSDQIHLRTELLIPHGDTSSSRRTPTRGGGIDSCLPSPVEPTLALFPVTSSFIAARNAILSLPARMSLESLSSKASVSEDLEMDDLQAARSYKISAATTPLVAEGYELTTLTTPHVQYKRHDVSLSSPAPSRSPPHNQYLDFSDIPSTDFRSHSMCSSSALPNQLPRKQPFAALPVRTSQLEPEPAMELPVQRARI